MALTACCMSVSAQQVNIELHEEVPQNKKATSKDPPAQFVRLLYEGKPLKIPACQAAGKHHPQDKSLCTLESFMELSKRVSLSAEEYEQACGEK